MVRKLTMIASHQPSLETTYPATYTRPAWQLLLAASAPNPPADLRPLCNAIVDWPAWLVLATEQGVIPLVSRCLLGSEAGLMPDEYRQQLLQKRNSNIRKTLLLEAELLRVFDELAKQAVPLIPFKGTSLSRRAYGDISARRGGDIDVLIPEKDLLKADDCMLLLGYNRISPVYEPAEASLAALLACRHEAEYFHPQYRIRVQLHWRWLRNPEWLPMTFADLYSRCEPFTMSGRQLPGLPREEQFLYLCAHGVHHRWRRLMWLTDLRFILADPKLRPNFTQLTRMAERTATQPSLVLALALLRNLGEPLPSDWPYLAPSRPQQKLSHHCLNVLTQNQAALPRGTVSAIFDELLDEWRLLPGWRSRWRGIILARLLRPSDNDLQTLSLPKSLYFLYLPLRPWLWLYRQWQARS